jgi:hypothetical protein
MDKHSSLLGTFVNYGRKKLIRLDQLPLLYLLQKFNDSLREKIGSVVGVIEDFHLYVTRQNRLGRLSHVNFFGLFYTYKQEKETAHRGRYDTEHNDIQHNSRLNAALSITTPIIMADHCYAKCCLC